MINTVKDYNNIIGSILPMLSIFSLFMLSDRCGNWTLAALLIIISMALFMQTKGEY
jgi:hypothetical protein